MDRTLKPYGLNDDPLKKNLVIKQSTFVFNLTAPTSLNTIPTMSTDTHEVNIESSGNWYVKGGYPSWLNISPIEGESGNSTIKVSPKDGNPDLNNDRVGVVTIISKAHEANGQLLSKEFRVLQQKFIFELSKTDFTFGAIDFDSQPRSLVVKSSSAWRVTDKPSWLDLDVKNGEGGEDKEVNIIPTNNVETSVRMGKIIFKNDFNNHIIEVNVTQEAFVFDDSNVELHFTCIPSAPQNFNVICMGSWKIQGGNDVNFSPMQGVGNTSVSVNLNANYTTSVKEFSYTLSSELNNKLKRSIIIRQDSFKFDSTSETYTFAASGNDTKSIDIICSGPWNVNAVPAWIKLSKENGVGEISGKSESIEVSVEKNESTEPRTAELRFVSKNNSALVKVVTINQDAAPNE